MTCTLDRCTRDHYARGYCEMHYRRWKRTGDPGPAVPLAGITPEKCAVSACTNDATERGWCHGHYQRWRRCGDVQESVPLLRRRQPDECTVERCTRTPKARGLCKTHYGRWLRHGDPRAAQPIRVVTGSGSLSHGYKQIPIPKDLRHLTNGETPYPEHRFVMARELGRPLASDEVVHHINGVRTDNRRENLELWSIAHPKGQRVPDKVAFAIDMIRRYRPELAAGWDTAL